MHLLYKRTFEPTDLHKDKSLLVDSLFFQGRLWDGRQLASDRLSVRLGCPRPVSICRSGYFVGLKWRAACRGSRTGSCRQFAISCQFCYLAGVVRVWQHTPYFAVP